MKDKEILKVFQRIQAMGILPNKNAENFIAQELSQLLDNDIDILKKELAELKKRKFKNHGDIDRFLEFLEINPPKNFLLD